MLLEEIKANLSSDEDTSSDEQPEEGKKKPAKQTENTADNGKHQKASGKEVVLWHLSWFTRVTWEKDDC